MVDTPDLGLLIEEWRPYADAATVYRNYDEGRHELRFATKDFIEKYGDVVKSVRENLCPAVISAYADALAIESWGTNAAEQVADEEGLARLADLVHPEALRTGDSYVLTWPGADGSPVPHFHRAELMHPKVSPDDPGKLEWCAKIWLDRSNRLGRINIYFDDRVERFATTQTYNRDAAVRLPESGNSWAPWVDDDGDAIVEHSFGDVPVAWFKNNAVDQQSHGRSILADVIPLQDGLNSSLAHMLVTGESYAKPFWYLLNYKPKDPTNPFAVANEYQQLLANLQTATEQVVPASPASLERGRRFDRGRQSIFTHDGPGPFGQLDPPDLSKLIEVQDAFALKVARVAGIPSYWFTQTSGDVPSGESLRVLTTRRNAAIGRFQRSTTPVWRGLAKLLGMGDNITPKWANPMPIDEAEAVEIAAGKRSLGYTLEDAIAGLQEADPEGIIRRATEEKTRSTEAMGKALRDGAIGY